MKNLEEYLDKKRIDTARLKAEMPELWAKWEDAYARMGEAAFDHEKKFLLNPIRLQFPRPAEG